MRDADQEQLDRVVALLSEVLGPVTVGAYLFGSAAQGGLRPRSDLDVLAVSNRRTTREEKERIANRLLAISGRSTPQGTWRNVELTIVVESEIKPWRYPPRRDFQYGQRFRAAFESGNLSPWPTATDPELAALITMVLLANSPVVGPPPAAIFDPVPHHDLIRAIVGDIEAWLDDLDTDTRNVILALARIWSTVATGVIRSKDAAAGWALERLPEEHRAVLARARAIYLGDEEERWNDVKPRVRPYADHVSGEIHKLTLRPRDREISDRGCATVGPRGSIDARIDDGVRRRLTARFGVEVAPWFDELPDVLAALEERWQIEFGSFSPRGSMSVVIRCRMPDGGAAVLKVSPDRARLANEAAALERWTTIHTPSVLAVDESVGALLMEAIEPGTALVESLIYPDVETAADLLTSLQVSAVPDSSYRPLAHRVAYLFDSGTKPYKRHPELLELIPLELYKRGRQLATRLAESVRPTALLHGDLTPSNILDGGAQRGLVAIDPAPCLGDDLGYDAIDLVLWQADDIDVVVKRTEQLAPAIDVDAGRLLDWCTAFAGMTALELAESPNTSGHRVQAAVALANQVPKA
jgi:streptomycin 6-kinase/predicted nucleotidyltransferase